jgi:ABC-type glycerol-3-phosphate transport system permease component
MFVLLFPFYWMAITSIKSNAELYDYEHFSPFWVSQPTFANIEKLLFHTPYPDWLWNTVLVSVVSTFLSLFASVFAAYAIERLRYTGSRYVGMSIFLSPIWCRLRSYSFRLRRWSTNSGCSILASPLSLLTPRSSFRFARGC